MLGRHFHWYYFQSPRTSLTLIPKRGVEMGGHNLTLELRPNGGRWSKTLHLRWQVLGSRGWAFDWHNSRPPNSIPRGAHKFIFEITAKRCQIVQKFVSRGIRKSWVSFRLARLPTPNSHLTFQTLTIGDPENFHLQQNGGRERKTMYWDIRKPYVGFRLVQIPTHLNYGQTAADGATLGTERRCEVIVVASALKYSFDSH